jgi:hypothetical protein
MDQARTKQMTRLMACVVLLSFFLGPSCHKPAPASESQTSTPNEQEKRAEQAAEMPASLRKHWTFLNRLRQDDSYSDIDRTLVNDQDELGVVLSSRIQSGQIEPLLQRVLKEMAREFPDEDITLNAYEPSKPLRKLSRVQLDGKTGEIRYEGAR